MQKIAIIGAGISGLSVAQMLKAQCEVTVFEKENRPGGMVKCDRVNGHLFHRTGGHVFNTKNKDVLEWFWGRFDKNEEFVKANRYSVVYMPDKRIVTYPIENHAYQFSEEMMKGFIDDLIAMASGKTGDAENFEQFLQMRFGETLYREYFQPYNEKIWRRPLTDVPLSWLEGKLPMPTLEEMLYNNFKHIEERKFVHSTFYYPLKGGSQFVANRLSEGLNVRYDTPIHQIEKQGNEWWVMDESFDKIVFCGNIKDIPQIVQGIDLNGFANSIENLEAHGTTTVLCEIEDNPYSWIYLPSRAYQAHRIICTGNFASSNKNGQRMSATIEFTDEVKLEDILENLKQMPFSPQYLTHHYEKYTYPIQAADTRELINQVKSATEREGLYLLGRFAEWEYYNMDVAMGAGMNLCKHIMTIE